MPLSDSQATIEHTLLSQLDVSAAAPSPENRGLGCSQPCWHDSLSLSTSSSDELSSSHRAAHGWSVLVAGRARGVRAAQPRLRFQIA